jgi:hypothetical protein
MIKLLILILVVIFSINSLAQIRYEDGSYYNDDYIYKDQPATRSPVSLFDNTNPPIVHEAPTQELPKPSESHIRPKRPKKQPGGFVEVEVGGSRGDFQEIRDGEIPSRGRSRSAR